MKSIRPLLTAASLATALTLCGCAATVHKDAPTGFVGTPIKVPAEATQRLVLNLQLDARHANDSSWKGFRQEWIDIMKEQAAAKGVKFEVQDGDVRPSGEPGVLLAVRVNDYKHVTVGQRMMLGIMTGNAFIDAKAEFRDLRSGAVLGDRSYNTSSSAGQGVFAPVTPKQIYAISDDVLSELKGR
jgi:hypothetical protein